MKRILIVDGDMAVRAQIGRYARLEGYDVAEASDGYTAVALFRQRTFDYEILAVRLSELDVFFVCQTIRRFSQVPFVILSERGDEADRIRGLELGADDYVVKPFSPRELMLRISAIMKRGPLLDSMRQRSIEQDGIYIDLIARRVMVDGNQVSLTPKEFDLLLLFARNKNRALYRETIYETVWGGEYMGQSRTVDLHVQRLKKKLHWEEMIVAVYKVGYRLNEVRS